MSKLIIEKVEQYIESLKVIDSLVIFKILTLDLRPFCNSKKTSVLLPESRKSHF
jgi:hypothetical protein